ncbi:hypothetical protein SDC9_75801 [bioreactor metagenome]|uniref:Uncharacterized protein n=1 Tax=bioreactor metagenome TaxID=1076179 RepID=A0A644YN00_9ZZZZ
MPSLGACLLLGGNLSAHTLTYIGGGINHSVFIAGEFFSVLY